MKLQDILLILQNRIIALNESRRSAVASGNVDQVSQIDADLLSTQDSIQRIQSSLGSN